MPSLGGVLSARLSALRERHPAADHAIRTVGYYSGRNGNAQAGAVTFFAFLSFFPILALSFFVVGWLATVFPDLRREVMQAIETVLPGVVGSEEGEISLAELEKYAGAVGGVGAIGVLYSGLGWVSGMRRALQLMFQLPPQEEPSFLKGLARDLRSLVVLGLVLLVSISLSGAMTWFSEVILGRLGLDGSWFATGVLWVVGHGLAIAATALLFVAMFTLLAKPHVASRALWQGAWAGAVGFEVLKGVANLLIGMTKGQPAFQAFGVALILLVWINYFSRLVMLSAAWAYTAPVAEQVRALEAASLAGEEETEVLVPAPAAVVAEDPDGSPLPQTVRVRRRAGQRGVLSVAGAGAVGALTWLARRRQR